MSFWTTQLLIRLITSYIGSCAFAIVFKINRRHLWLVGFSGMVAYFIYHSMLYTTASVFAASFVCALVVATFGEMCARWFRAPAVVFWVTGLIPIVPGGDSYYAMKFLLQGDMAQALDKIIFTGQVALGIAGGIVLVSIIFGILTDRARKKAQNR